MKLSTQLVALVASLIVILFIGTFWINIQNGRTYLVDQLASHAQDGATSLGLSVTSHLALGDRATVKSLADAMFDSGDYLQVRVEGLAGEDWVERRAERQAPGVPGWFVNWISLDTPQGAADVMRGWRQGGRVLVRSNPGHAYEQLWANARASFIWYLVGAGIALMIGVVALRWLLRPLREVEQQATAICDRRFPAPLKIPFAIEFRSVIHAMNRLTGKVQRMLADSERLVLKLRSQVNSDPVTGLVNRRFFMDVLENRVNDPAGFAGGLLLIELRDIKGYNQTYGYPAGDQLLRACGELLTEQLQGMPECTLAHMSGANFAILTEGQDPREFTHTGQHIAASVATLGGRVELPSTDVGHVGGAYFRDHTGRQLLSEADVALRKAQTIGANECVLTLTGEEGFVERSRSEWRQLINDGLSEGRLKLVWQPVFTCDGTLLHREAFVRLPDPDNANRLLAAGHFLPMTEAGGLASSLDRYVIERVLQKLRRDKRSVAINLSPVSLTDNELLAWLQQLLVMDDSLGEHLILEVSEYGATAYPQQLRNWITRLRPLGIRFTLDHFGQGFGSLRHLRSLKVDFLKIDGAFVQEIDANEDNQFLLEVIRGLAHSLDIQVIAEAVESEPVWRQLGVLGVDGGQGYWLGEPELEN